MSYSLITATLNRWGDTMSSNSALDMMQQIQADDNPDGSSESYYDDVDGGEDSIEELAPVKDERVEWLISPTHFVDFWVSALFLLVGTWQVITMLFLISN